MQEGGERCGTAGGGGQGCTWHIKRDASYRIPYYEIHIVSWKPWKCLGPFAS